MAIDSKQDQISFSSIPCAFSRLNLCVVSSVEKALTAQPDGRSLVLGGAPLHVCWHFSPMVLQAGDS